MVCLRAFDDVQSWAAIFVASLADYDSLCGDDRGVRRGARGLRSYLDDFDTVCKDRRMCETPLILLLSDRDQFERRYALLGAASRSRSTRPDRRPCGQTCPATLASPVELVIWHFEQRQLEAVHRGLRRTDRDLMSYAGFQPNSQCSTSFMPLWKALQTFLISIPLETHPWM